jgi:hypothetical protein
MRTLRGPSLEWTARTEEVPLRELIAVPVDAGKSSAMVMACDFTGRVLIELAAWVAHRRRHERPCPPARPGSSGRSCKPAWPSWATSKPRSRLDIPALRTLFGLKNRPHHNRAAGPPAQAADGASVR